MISCLLNSVLLERQMCFLVLVSVQPLRHNTWSNQLIMEKFHFGSWFQRFWSMFHWLRCFLGQWWVQHPSWGVWQRTAVQFMKVEKQRGRERDLHPRTHTSDLTHSHLFTTPTHSDSTTSWRHRAFEAPLTCNPFTCLTRSDSVSENIQRFQVL